MMIVQSTKKMRWHFYAFRAPAIGRHVAIGKRAAMVADVTVEEFEHVGQSGIGLKR